MSDGPYAVVVTTHAKRALGVFNNILDAASYPGPRMLECSEKTAEIYVNINSLMLMAEGFEGTETMTDVIEQIEEIVKAAHECVGVAR